NKYSLHNYFLHPKSLSTIIIAERHKSSHILFIFCLFFLHMSQFHKSITGCKIRTLISAREWLSLQADAFRGHGLSLLTRKIRSLWGLRTRAVPAGVAALRYSHSS